MSKEDQKSKLLSEPYPNDDEDDNDDEEDDDYRPSEDEDADHTSSGDEHHDVINGGKEWNEESKQSSAAKLELTEDKKKRANELWADLYDSTKKTVKKAMNEPSNRIPGTSLSASKSVPANLEKSSFPHKKVKEKVSKVYDFAGEKVIVEEIATKKTKDLDNGTSSTSFNTVGQTQFKPSTTIPIKRSAGLGSLISSLTKKSKMSTLTKTKLDWDVFKKDEGIEDELRNHVKNKDSFVERQAFLKRADFKQFEIEKSIREKSRLRDNK